MFMRRKKQEIEKQDMTSQEGRDWNQEKLQTDAHLYQKSWSQLGKQVLWINGLFTHVGQNYHEQLKSNLQDHILQMGYYTYSFMQLIFTKWLLYTRPLWYIGFRNTNEEC